MSVTQTIMLTICLGLICALHVHAGLAVSQEHLEELYKNTPAVPDERLADAELDNAYDIYKWNATIHWPTVGKTNSRDVNQNHID
ncbi:uncharacterized protein LOC115632935 [Scaptodrosophila lebanonensis]|uniref:Uncharacterized protein LOC115632935 n=1 Tax=Drosophila lebanonensis TaxID=7225 RepID=A0A6J2UFA2_DROLE|nr:uncharacterized protein LOC115632935 [Scaptodrosophila lebanonensis]